MALVKATVRSDIEAAFTEVMNDRSADREGAIGRLSDKLATAVINAIQSADINYRTGLIAPSMGGTVTGKFEGNLQ